MGRAENEVERFIDDWMSKRGWLRLKINSGQKGHIWFNEWSIPPDIETMLIENLNSAEILEWYRIRDEMPFHGGVSDRIYFRPVAEVLIVEVKTKVGRPARLQKIWLKVFELMGFNAILPMGSEDFMRQYKEIYGDEPPRL